MPPDATFPIVLRDARGKHPDWYLQLDGGFGASGIEFLSDDANNIYIRNVGKRIGDFDEQRDWSGGRGGEFFSDDPSRYFDGYNIWAPSSGHLTQTLQWKIATGYRSAIQNLPGNMAWKALTGDTRYIAVSLAELTGADKAWVWVRRVGTPGTLTLEIRSASGGDPNGTVQKTATVTTSDITDVISVWKSFDWTTTYNITSGDFLVLYGASTDNVRDHWEIGCDAATAGKSDANGSGTWTTTTYSPYYRITDADTARRWFLYGDGTNFFAVDKKDSGASQLFSIDTSAVATEKTSTGLGTVTGRPIILNAYHFFPQGESTNIRRWNGNATWADDGTNKATFLVGGYDPTDGAVVWRANTTAGTTSSVSRANAGVAGLTFKTAIPIGDLTGTINGIYFWINNGLYIWKHNSVWSVANDKATYLDYGVKNTPSTINGVMALASQQFLLYNWLFSLERLASGQLDDVGQGWKDAGLPSGREGYYSGGCTYVGNWVFLCVDAGASGYSSVQSFNGIAFHEIFRAPAAGMRIRDVALQPITDARTKLWIDCGGDLFYLTLPLNKARPLDDPSVPYQHEGVLISSTIDMGAASKLPKFIKSLTATTANLNGSGRRIECEYQIDDGIGLEGWGKWRSVQSFLRSPEDTIDINAENITQFRYRLRLLTDTATTPVDLKGVVPNGLARGPQRIVWSMRIKADKVSSGGRTTDPNELLAYLIEAQTSPGRVIMTSTNPLFGGREGVMVQLSIQHIRPITDTKSSFTLVLVSS